jgi:DnaJ-class molecular chaperone
MTNGNLVKCECAKCNGKGEIRAFSGIAGGVCFDCNGRGYIMRKATYMPSKKFGADFGEGVVCWKNAKTEAAARKAFNAQFSQSKMAGKEFKIVEWE